MSEIDQNARSEVVSDPPTKAEPPAYMANANGEEYRANSSMFQRMKTMYQRTCNSQRFQMLCRTFQTLSSIVGFILFAYRYYKIVHTLTRATTASNDAVLSILVIAVVYDIGSLVGRHILKNGGPNYVRVIWIVADIAFVVAFIMVAELTSPGRGMTSGPCRTIKGINLQEFGINCTLPTGTFVTAIVNTILHAVTAIFNPIIGQFKKRKARKNAEEVITESELQGDDRRL